jgi:3-oxoacyl-ACP reductase-like protein
MSIFGAIKDAIFGHAAAAATPAEAPAADAAPAAEAPAAPEVDVDAVLTGLATGDKAELNYKTSIVDLMTLLDIDHSLAHREDLAKELGYTGELNGSAEMNEWLHQEVLEQLAKNGGKVPADLLKA